MIKTENYEVVGWEHAIRGMRNPLNSWDKSDTNWKFYWHEDYNDVFNSGATILDTACPDENGTDILALGNNDKSLMMKLRKAGTDHRKFMRMITVYVDITAPLYWWKEFDTYKVGTVANSCSTMHKIHEKEFILDDFSHEHLFDDDVFQSNVDILQFVIDALNFAREDFIKTKDKKYWWQMIQLLPSSYNQKRTVMLNYEVLANMYKSRKNHKLDEWHELCKWMKELPYSELITGEEE